MTRNIWILVGVAGIAFLVFLLLGRGENSSPTADGSGILGVFRGGQEKASGSLGTSDTGTGETASGAAAAGGGRSPGAGLAGRSARQKAKGRVAADPDLVKRLQVGGGDLVPIGPASSPRAGLVQQFFRGGTPSSGPSGTVVAGGGGPDPAPAPEPDTQDKNDCGAPKVRKTIIDLQENPIMHSVFNVPAASVMIDNGNGERFNIGDAPAYVIYIPRSKTGGGGAIFDNRFLVSIQGRCIPSREFLKSLLKK
jgi:hypothetical protein